MSERFYVNCPLGPGEVAISGPEAHHLAAVCRVRPGDRVCLFNGDGHQYPAEVDAVSRKSVNLRVLGVEIPQRELPFRLVVAVPLPKGDRAQFLVEKLTEIGVTTLVPLRTARSVVHPGEGKREKLQRWVIEASKQCGRNVLLQIEPLSDWANCCRRGDLPPARWVAHPGGDRETGRQRDTRGDVVVAVGPEGGFTQEEIDCALATEWQQVSLGPRVLRVETAAIVLAGMIACRPDIPV